MTAPAPGTAEAAQHRLDPSPAPDDPELLKRIDDHWEERPGLTGLLTTVDHKRIGLAYIITAFFVFLLAGMLALTMRAQLAQPQGDVLDPETYGQLFTMHGTAMVLLFATPVLIGFASYLLPLMLGTRQLAFPRLNAFSYWLYLLAALLMASSLGLNDAPDGGWASTTPLSSTEYSSGHGIDIWALAVVLVGISTITSAVNFLVTTQKLRAPGMGIDRIPLFVWSVVAMSLMAIFAVPALILAAGLLALDRLAGTVVFSPALGGDVLLYQHLFWFWGRPEVYMLLLPAVGIVSTIIPVATRTSHAGYRWAVVAFAAVASLSFVGWVHHMSTTGIPTGAAGFFAVASTIVVIPLAVLYSCWIATMLLGRVRFTVPMLYVAGFLATFLVGLISGVMLSSLPFSLQTADSYFAVAHFHYVLNGGVVFPIFAAIYHWFPKMTGRQLDQGLGRWSFWVMALTFQLTFFPMHILGLLGMPRRVYTYEEGLGWSALNLTISIGAAAFAVGVLLTLVNVALTLRRGQRTEADPWGGDTLEWSVPSPPPRYNFLATPAVRGVSPLWEPPGGELTSSGDEDATSALGPEGALERASTVTSGADARPSGRVTAPEPSWLPVVAAAAVVVTAVGAVYQALLVLAAGGAAGLVAVLWWTWQTEGDGR